MQKENLIGNVHYRHSKESQYYSKKLSVPFQGEKSLEIYYTNHKEP